MIKKYFFSGILLFSSYNFGMEQEIDKFSMLGKRISKMETPLIIANTTDYEILVTIEIGDATTQEKISSKKNRVLIDASEVKDIKSIKFEVVVNPLSSWLSSSVKSLKFEQQIIAERNLYIANLVRKKSKAIYLRIELSKNPANLEEKMLDLSYPSVDNVNSEPNVYDIQY